MLTPLADIAGNNQVVQFSASRLSAAWIQVIVTGFGTVRLGSNAGVPSATFGLPIPAGGGFFYPWRKMPEHNPYDLSQEQAYIPTGATLSIAYQPT